MSRFWNGSDSSEESEQESSSDESEQLNIKKQTDRKFASAFDESDSDSEDEVREVKSQKDRTWDAVCESCSKLRSSLRNEDWSLIQDDFEKVNKQAEKCKDTPPAYVKVLMELEDLLSSTLKDKEKVKSLKPAASRALNQMKLRVRKHNENFKELINDCRENPDKYEEKVVKSGRKDESDSESDSDSSNESSSDDSSSSSESETELTGRAKWLKKPALGELKKNEEKAEKEREKQVERSGRNVDRVHVEKPKVELAVARSEITEKELDEKVAELIASRGRKGVDQREMVRGLEVLSKVARSFGPVKEIPVLMHLISAMFDIQRSIDDFMDLLQWNSCFRSLSRVVALLSTNSNLRLRPLDVDEVNGSINGESMPSDKSIFRIIPVSGSLESVIVKLEEEYNKSLQQINPHTKDYVVRLANEANLMELEEKILAYYRSVGDNRPAAAVALLIVGHIYYKHDSQAKAVAQAHAFTQKWGSFSDLHPACKGRSTVTGNVDSVHPASLAGHPTVIVDSTNFCSKLEDLCSFIFTFGDERNKTRALLSCVFYHALHDNYYRARDLFLLSHVQDFIDKAEIKTQILYNRAVVNLGLCAFRAGLFTKAHDCLSVICSGRTKELLAQGTSRSNDKDFEQEKLEKRRQMPYHMHINPDLLECCHLTCAMILELPHLARGIATGSSSAVVSRQLRKHLANYNKQPFIGPPETTREHVLAATKAILAGDWRKACTYLLDLEVWKLIPGDKGAHIKVLLRSRIQEEAIRCYLLLNSNSYDSIELDTLCSMFDLEQTQVRKIICHMIFNKEISASWESSGHILTIYKVEPSSLQLSAQQVSQKLSQLLESNEHIVDALNGVYGYKDDGNARDGKKTWSNGQEHSGFRKGRHFGLKSSQRPVVQKGNRNMRAPRKDGGNNMSKSAWGQKSRRGDDE